MRPRAQFKPIPHDLDLNALVEAHEHLEYAHRIPFHHVVQYGMDRLEKLVNMLVLDQGRPLIVEAFDRNLEPWTFSPKWLRDNVGTKVEQARDLNRGENLPLTIGHYLKNMGAVANQHFRQQQEGAKQPQRIYLKDIDCPSVWQDKLRDVIPKFLFYLNESTGEQGGPGASADSNPNTSGSRLGVGIAKAGDLMSSLPVDMRAENMMCYIGHEGTYTPAHREMCATIGQNIMVEASTDVGEDGTPEKPGTSIWFMAEAEDRQLVSEYWLSTLGHDIETENHFAQISAWKKAPFKVYVIEQKPGDLVIIPPLAPHQVWNRGTRTIKAAWNRTTPETLGLALTEALPKARMVCRDEQYKNKAIVYYTLLKYSKLLALATSQAARLPQSAGRQMLSTGRIAGLHRDFGTLLKYFKTILLSEMWDPETEQEDCEYLPFDGNVTCAYCRGNIFNRFLSCPSCADDLGYAEPEAYDICMDCYVMGRSCYCISGMKWVEQFKWDSLLNIFEKCRTQYNQLQLLVTKPKPQMSLSLNQERYLQKKRTLAEVTRMQLKCRPFQDSSKPQSKAIYLNDQPSDEEIIVDDEGRIKKTVKKRPKDWSKHNATCHICKNPHEKWKMTRCTKCQRYYCYSTLFRGHDDMPLDVMEDPEWVCVHCNGVCFGGTCAKLPDQKPFQPKGTLLGHDTKAVADIRSVEVLIDFSVSNMYWIRPDNDTDESAQLRMARAKADEAKQLAWNNMVEDDDHVQDADGADDDVLPTEDEIMAASLTRFNQDESLHGPEIAGGDQTHDGYAPAVDGSHVQRYFYDAPRDNSAFTDPIVSNDVDMPQASPNQDQDASFTDTQGISQGQKRGREQQGDDDDEIAMEMPRKKARAVEGFAMLRKIRTEAGKQFQDLSNKKALDRAKLQGRYYAVRAAQLGRKRLLKFNLPGDRLAAIINTSQTNATHPYLQRDADSSMDREGADVLRSDVPQTRPVPRPESTTTSVEHKRGQARSEDAGRYQLGKLGSGTKGRTSDAEASDSDSERDANDDEQAASQPALQNGKRRRNAYMQAKHGGDGELDALSYEPTRQKRRRTAPAAMSRDTADEEEQEEVVAPVKTARVGRARPSAGRLPGKARRRTSPIRPVSVHEINEEPEDEPGLEGMGAIASQSETVELANRQAKMQALAMLDDVEADLDMVAPIANMGHSSARG